MQRVRGLVAAPSDLEKFAGRVAIAVLDTGVGRHPDLSGALLCFRDFVEHRSLAYDDNGHGTHVCGILCGSGVLSEGKYRGMAPGAELVVGKVLDGKGDGSTGAMLDGLDWVLDVREKYNIRILNISVGIGGLDDEGKERALRAKVDEVWDSGILVVCAAGNKGPGDGSISAVCAGRKAVTVGCYDGDYGCERPNRCETYSGRGERGSLVRKPDLVAPGTDIVSCSAQIYKVNGKYRNAYTVKSGTSMATPIVSGAAALAFGKNPEMTNEECRKRLLFTADDLGLPWNQQGFGMINVERFLG